MTARYLSGADLGRVIGVSRQAVGEAKRKGMIHTNAEGLFDLLDPDIDQWLKKLPFQRTAAAHKRDREAASPATAENPPEIVDLQDGELDRNARNRSARGSTRDDPSFATSERKLKAAQASYWECRAKERRGDLLPKVLVETFLNKLYVIDQSMFLSRGDRMAADIVAMVHNASDDASAELQVNKALMEDACSEQRSKKRQLEDFLESIKAKLGDAPGEGADDDHE
jgi:hypothetical protein